MRTTSDDGDPGRDGDGRARGGQRDRDAVQRDVAWRAGRRATRSSSPYVRARSAVCSRSSSSSGSSLPSPAARRSRSVTASRSASEARSDEWRAIAPQRYRYVPSMGRGGDVQLAGRRPRLPDVHRHRVRGRRALRLPDRLRDPGEHRPAALPRLPLAQEPHLPRRDPRRSCSRVHFVPEEAEDLAELFGGETGDEVDKFERCAWRPGPGRHAAARRLPQPLRRPRARAHGRAATTTRSCSSRCSPSAAPTPTSSRFHRAKRIEPGHEA